jgi:ABC-2 type transport system ATP-binding protein
MARPSVRDGLILTGDPNWPTIQRLMNSIEVTHLRVLRGGRPVIHDLTCAVASGTVTGLLGPSGSGKTTLLRAIVGVQQNVLGKVSVLGLPAGSADLRSRVGYVTQESAVYQDLTVRENLHYFAALVSAPADRVTEVLGIVSLADRADALVGQVSGGERARVSLAASLLGSPRLLVLDEPTVGLDPVLREELWSVFRHLAGQGVTLLVSSHVMDEADRCQRLLLLREGALLADATPAELRQRTGTENLDQAFLRLIVNGVAA